LTLLSGSDSGDRKKDGGDRGKPRQIRPHKLPCYQIYRQKQSAGNQPETGRTTRFAFTWRQSAIRFLADITYGKKSAFLNRQFLHAHRIGFNLPATGKWVEFESPLPEDLLSGAEGIGQIIVESGAYALYWFYE